MEKLYSKTALSAKAIYCVLLAPLYMLISSLITAEDVFLHLLLAVLPVGCLYTVPFWFSASYLHKYRTKGIKKYIALDALTCFVPAFAGILIVDIIYSVTVEKMASSGIVTIIFSLIFLLITIIFWFIYFVLNKIK